MEVSDYLQRTIESELDEAFNQGIREAVQALRDWLATMRPAVNEDDTEGMDPIYIEGVEDAIATVEEQLGGRQDPTQPRLRKDTTMTTTTTAPTTGISQDARDRAAHYLTMLAAHIHGGVDLTAGFFVEASRYGNITIQLRSNQLDLLCEWAGYLGLPEPAAVGNVLATDGRPWRVWQSLGDGIRVWTGVDEPEAPAGEDAQAREDFQTMGHELDSPVQREYDSGETERRLDDAEAERVEHAEPGDPRSRS